MEQLFNLQCGRPFKFLPTSRSAASRRPGARKENASTNSGSCSVSGRSAVAKPERHEAVTSQSKSGNRTDRVGEPQTDSR